MIYGLKVILPWEKRPSFPSLPCKDNKFWNILHKFYRYNYDYFSIYFIFGMISYFFIKKPHVLVKNKRVKVQKKTITTSLKQKHKAALQIKKHQSPQRRHTYINKDTCRPHTKQIHRPGVHTTQSRETPKAKTSDSCKKHPISSK